MPEGQWPAPPILRFCNAAAENPASIIYYTNVTIQLYKN